MPCNTIQTSKIEFKADATNVDLLSDALRALGFNVNRQGDVLGFSKSGAYGKYAITSGELEVASPFLDAAAVKRAYSEQVVMSQAKKFGWQVSWKVNSSGNREARVVKRA